MNEKQYLEADLETLRGMVFLPEHMNTIEYVGEILERAIAAEEELNETYIDENGAVWNRPTAWAYYAVCKAKNKWQEQAEKAADRISTLTEENDIQRQAIQNLSTQVAGLRDGLSRISETEACQTELKIKMKQFKMGFAFNREIFEKNNANCKCPKCTADRLLASPDPGEKIMAVVEAVKYALAQEIRLEGRLVIDWTGVSILKQALADLEGSL